ncbi:Fe(3+) ABC transporter substrate-binding protein [Arcobacter sp. CECT 8985]|uniref:Fe(3+) ABC transporter substrate-binding protein n=1 Tax=Arcobacter sp. CECT 8985 TaxID=1935424 RepID=UPI00100A88B2|nr:Fe(3+) ABC transporter substrate-binding protein [Arcobacter sp. CECT 8985]RXJ86340.1 Fe(3+) ABC transporter substrate-binding protein [Arcobacter sp. CECT 8985]
MIKNFALGAVILASSLFASGEVNVYSHRHYDTDKKLFKMFEKKTGIKVNVVKAKASALIKRIETEGKKSPADVLITVDAGRLYQAKKEGILQPIHSDYLIKNIPANLRDKDNEWFGVTIRSRVTAYRIGSGMKDKLSTYEDLADPKFKGKLMVRSSNSIYNQSLMAAMIAHHGKDYAIKWAKGVVENLASSPKGDDTYQVKAIANGIGSVALVNTYYIGKMAGNNDLSQAESVRKIKVFFPKFENGGTHINISGAAVAKYAPHKENAIKFIEFLTSKEAQKIFTQENFEYPVLKGVQNTDIAKAWGTFTPDNISLDELGKYNKQAVMAFDIAGWK